MISTLFAALAVAAQPTIVHTITDASMDFIAVSSYGLSGVSSSVPTGTTLTLSKQLGSWVVAR